MNDKNKPLTVGEFEKAVTKIEIKDANGINSEDDLFGLLERIAEAPVDDSIPPMYANYPDIADIVNAKDMFPMCKFERLAGIFRRDVEMLIKNGMNADSEEEILIRILSVMFAINDVTFETGCGDVNCDDVESAPTRLCSDALPQNEYFDEICYNLDIAADLLDKAVAEMSYEKINCLCFPFFMFLHSRISSYLVYYMNVDPKDVK